MTVVTAPEVFIPFIHQKVQMLKFVVVPGISHHSNELNSVTRLSCEQVWITLWLSFLICKIRPAHAQPRLRRRCRVLGSRPPFGAGPWGWPDHCPLVVRRGVQPGQRPGAHPCYGSCGLTGMCQIVTWSDDFPFSWLTWLFRK